MALDALRAELDAQEYDASRIEDSVGQNELFAPHASCEVSIFLLFVFLCLPVKDSTRSALNRGPGS